METRKRKTGKEKQLCGRKKISQSTLLRVILKTTTERAGIKNKVTTVPREKTQEGHSEKKGTKVKVTETSGAL